MKDYRYIRDSRTNTLVLRDSAEISKFRQNRTVTSDLESLRRDIDILKEQMRELHQLIANSQTSE
jgi:hypothetical protein